MDNEMIARIVVVVCALAAFTAIIFFILKKVFRACWRGNRVAPADTPQPAFEMHHAPDESTLELPPPTYEEATSGQPRRRRVSPKDNTTSIDGRDVNGTQLAGAEGTGERNTTVGGSGGKYSGISSRNTRDDSGVTLNVEGENDMNTSSRDGGNTSTADDSGVKSGGGEDTVDKFDVNSISKYDTASEASGSLGGRDSTAPLPWSSF